MIASAYRKVFLGEQTAAVEKPPEALILPPQPVLPPNIQQSLAGESEAFAKTQDFAFPSSLLKAEKLMVLLVPEHNEMSGGIYSIISVANQMRRLKRYHGYEIVVMTRPSPTRLTYFRNTRFRNSENIFRIEQLPLCQAAREIYLHIPEYAAPHFVRDLTYEELHYLLGRPRVYVNLLNQNIKLMPDKELFASLRRVSDHLTQSVAHHAYFNQKIADKYQLPTLLLPAYTDLNDYPASSFAEKEKLIIYSLDNAAHKKKCLRKIAESFPDFELLEIKNISFDQYMDYATRCMFSISFGEGFDGYVAQPFYQGGIGFAIYDPEFFPSEEFRKYYNIFDNADEMVGQICTRMRKLMLDRDSYERLNTEYLRELKRLYSFEDYIEQIKKLSLRQFEILPTTRQQ